jgi:hypothetical protein
MGRSHMQEARAAAKIEVVRARSLSVGHVRVFRTILDHRRSRFVVSPAACRGRGIVCEAAVYRVMHVPPVLNDQGSSMALGWDISPCGIRFGAYR